MWVVLVAGYYVWRADHLRMIPKLVVRGTRVQDTPITANGMIYDNRRFVQLTPTCLTDAPVYECVAYLQRVERFDGNRWEETSLDRNLIQLDK